MKAKYRLGFGLLMGLLLGLSLSMTLSVFAERNAGPAAAQEALPLEELRRLTEVYGRIKRDYVEDVDDKELLENAIRGMLTGLDPHSDYLGEEEFKELQIGTSGEFGGLGIEVGMEDGFVKVIAPIDDTPAQRAGVRAGDLIIRLDDKPVKGLSLNEAVKLMRGKKGTDIILTIVREGVDKPLEITITRDIIQVKSVKSHLLEPGYGYLRITNFQSRTTRDTLDAVQQLKADSDGRLKGLVIDLRNNPGGVLNGAVGVSDAFLEAGLIVYTEGRIEDSKLRYQASPGDVSDGAPIIVLVNEGSASASEIVAGALQDHDRALIMGTKTFGKGSVQTILQLTQDTALKLTTARYYTPNGRSIQADGIKPDIVVEPLQVAEADGGSSFRPLTEADLSRHLENGQIPGDASADQAGDGKSGDRSLAQRDYQLFEALNLLKGLNIVNKRG
ncbi:MAG: S41 family peptidase [Chromatiales bacterium]|nr:S41 family peptidase [Chromatiales bacterium]